MKAPTIQERILRVEELSHRARISLDLWIALNLDTAIAPYDKALDKFDDFWRFTRSAHESEFLIRITNLFIQDKRTANFVSVIADAKKSGAITSSVAAACSIKIAELGDIPERVALVRNKAMAHQHKLLKQNEAFNEAQITLKQMTKYSNVALEISAILKKAIGLEPIVVETQPAKTLKELLQYLEDRL